MKAKSIIFGIVIIVIVVVAVLFSRNSVPVEELVMTAKDPVVATFVDSKSKIGLQAIFQDGLVTFGIDPIGTTTLIQAESASGAKYANSDESVILWNHGNEVIVTHNGETIFAGNKK